MEEDDVVKEKSLKESHRIHQDVYDIRSQTLGEKHPYTLLTLSYLARVKLSQDWRFSVYDAIEILEHCLSTQLRLHGPEHEWALFTMVQLELAYRIREERGTQTHERLSLQLRMHLFEVYVHVKRFGLKHIDTHDSIREIAEILEDCSCFEAALPLRYCLVELLKTHRGPTHDLTFRAQLLLAHNLAESFGTTRKRHPESIYRTVLSHYDLKHGHYISTAESLLQLMVVLGDRKRALEWLEEQIGRFQQALPSSDEDLESLHEFAQEVRDPDFAHDENFRSSNFEVFLKSQTPALSDNAQWIFEALGIKDLNLSGLLRYEQNAYDSGPQTLRESDFNAFLYRPP